MVRFSTFELIGNEDFSNLLVTPRKKITIQLFLVVFLHIILFGFEDKYKPGLNLNLDLHLDLAHQNKKKGWVGVGLTLSVWLP